MLKRLFTYTLLNFGALAISGLFTPNGINSEWYTTLNKAPWTPPGWVFGVAWTTIMLCLALFMAISLKSPNSKLVKLYAVQLIMNISWTPVFFYFQKTIAGLGIITALTCLIAYLLYKYTYKLLITPYLLWLLIATSLNCYIVLYN